MRSEGLFEMNGIEKLNFIEVHTCKKNNFLLNNKYDIIFFQLLSTHLLNKNRNNHCITITLPPPHLHLRSTKNYLKNCS